MASRVSDCVLFSLALILCACAGNDAAPWPLTAYGGHHTPPGDAPLSDVTKANPLSAAADAPPLEVGAPNAATKSLIGFPVFTEPGDIPTLSIVEPGSRAPGGAGSASVKLPLKETRVVARLSQFVAEVQVTQRYENPRAEAIEAIYTFPLPENAAVDRMKMVIGDRTIEARIEERGRARRTYENAKREGFTAALLEQERPNIFTQSVANIEPNKPIEVVVRYVQDLSYDNGVHEFVFPMVVGPRFVQGAQYLGAQSGSGTKKDTVDVPDASRISPPYMGKGERSGRDFSIEIIADPSLAVGEYEAVTHEVQRKNDDEGRLHLNLAAKERIPNRDFVLRYRVATERPRATMLLSREDGGFFSLVVDPPDIDVEGLVGRREIIFVVDISGSMKGAPLALCKQAMQISLGKLRPVDTFNVISFAGSTAKLFEQPQPANDVALRGAMEFIDKMQAGGGTMMLDAVSAALSPSVEAGRHRYVFFLTDGFVSVEDQIMSSTRRFVADMEKRGQRAKVFGFGVGSSPNRALIDGLSREGKGVPVYATNREDPARGVNQFFRFIDRSVLRDVSIDWGGAKVSDASPGELPDLFASHPLIVHGRFVGSPSRPPVVHATSAKGPIDIPVQIVAPSKKDKRDVLGILWARSRMSGLEVDLASGDTGARATITKLGLDFGIVTRFTSFIAVDLSRRSSDGQPAPIVQPSDPPEGVDMRSALGQDAESARGGSDAPPSPMPSPDRGGERKAADQDQDGVTEVTRAGGMAPPPAAAQRNGACACRMAGDASSLGNGAWPLFALALLAWLRRLRVSRRVKGGRASDAWPWRRRASSR